MDKQKRRAMRPPFLAAWSCLIISLHVLELSFPVYVLVLFDFNRGNIITLKELTTHEQTRSAVRFLIFCTAPNIFLPILLHLVPLSSPSMSSLDRRPFALSNKFSRFLNEPISPQVPTGEWYARNVSDPQVYPGDVGVNWFFQKADGWSPVKVGRI